MDTTDVVVIGGGAAGLSAALLLGRSRRAVTVIDAREPRNRFAAHVNGVLGQRHTTPHELLAIGRAQLAEHDVLLRDGEVADVTRRPAGGYVARLADGDELAARAIVLASGIRDELPAIPGLAERWGRTVLHCPYCHGWEVRDRRLGVVATSTAAMHQVQLVRQLSEEVTLFTNGAFDPSSDERARLDARGIEVVAGAVQRLIGAGDELEAVVVGDAAHPVDAVFTAGVPRPQDAPLAGLGLARRADPAAGDVLDTDAVGRVPGEAVWAVGNVVQAMATVPAAIAAGAMAGAAANGELVLQDVDRALRAAH